MIANPPTLDQRLAEAERIIAEQQRIAAQIRRELTHLEAMAAV